MTTKPKTETKPQPDSEPDHGTFVVDLPNLAAAPDDSASQVDLLPLPPGIRQLVVDGSDNYGFLYALRTDNRIFCKNVSSGRESAWIEIETESLFEE